MKPQKGTKGLRSLGGFLCLFVAAFNLGAIQTQNKIIQWAKSPVGSNNEQVAPSLTLFRQIDAVEIEDIVVDGKPVVIGETFAAREDWLKTLTVRVKNVSNQRLVTIQLTLVIPEIDPFSPQVIYCYGCAENEKLKGIQPGEMVELKMPGADKYYDFVVSRVSEKRKIADVSIAQVSHFYITPPSGPIWYSGCVKTRDLKTPCPHAP